MSDRYSNCQSLKHLITHLEYFTDIREDLIPRTVNLVTACMDEAFDLGVGQYLDNEISKGTLKKALEEVFILAQKSRNGGYVDARQYYNIAVQALICTCGTVHPGSECPNNAL